MEVKTAITSVFFGITTCLLLFSKSAAAVETRFWKDLWKGREYFVQAQAGSYIPDNKNWKKIYGTDASFISEIRGGLSFSRNAEISASAGFCTDHGRGITGSGAESRQEFTIFLIPTSIELSYKLRYSDNQIIVPALGAGADGWYYEEDGGEEGKWTGFKTGGHITMRFNFLLDYLDPTGAKRVEKNYGLQNSYLSFEGKYISFSGAPDFSGWTLYIGLNLQF